MILPSNDAFIGNGNPVAFEIFDDNGGFLGEDFLLLEIEFGMQERKKMTKFLEMQQD